MNSTVKIKNRQIILILVALVAGLGLGWVFFHNAQTSVQEAHVHEAEAQQKTIWTCSMHPQIRQDEPGKCPICGMDLVPVSSLEHSGQEAGPGEVQMSESAIQLANVQTVTVTTGTPSVDVSLYGTVRPDETNIAAITARFGGRIEKLWVNYTGQKVKQHERLATIYSPQLLTAQKELLEAARYKDQNPSFYRSAVEKLKLWDISQTQIDDILQKKEPQPYFDILSPITGTVTSRKVARGDYVKEGSELFNVVDLTTVWVMFDAYESDMPRIETGDTVDFTLKAKPGKTFEGKVRFIDPVIDPQTRTARVRVEAANPGGSLMPGMFVNGIIHAKLENDEGLPLIPVSSVLWTGKRSVVWVRVPNRETPVFSYREITLGPKAGNRYVVEKGLNTGEVIATNGVFKIDAAAQLSGKTSMMNPPATTMKPGMMMNGQQNGQMKPGPEFTADFQPVLGAYLNLKNDLVETNLETAQSDANQLVGSLNGLIGKTKAPLKDALIQIRNQAEELAATENIDQARKSFISLSDRMISLSKKAGPFNEPVFVQFCPMANNNQGAFWLSTEKEIMNPYYGDMMLHCGEVRDVIDNENNK